MKSIALSKPIQVHNNKVTVLEIQERGCKIICVNGIFSKTFRGLQNAYQQRAY